MAYQYVLYDKRDRIATVTINRPEALNALHPPANQELRQIWEDFRDDPEVWVAVLTGAGDRAFSAGNDLKYTAEHPEMFEEFGDRAVFGGMVRDFECWKPIIAAVNGFALGGGCELALAADLVIASETASFGQPEVRVGLIAGAGGVFRLPRQIPLKTAMEVLLTARRMTAQEAYERGLVNKVVPPGELMTAARELAEQICENSPVAVQLTKELVLRGLDTSLDYPPHAWDLNKDAMRRLAKTQDFIEGPKAFAEKRKPRWTGR